MVTTSFVACDSAAPPPPAPTSPIRPAGGHLVDSDGRTALLRGVNIRAAGLFDGWKGHMPIPPFDAEADCRVIGEDLGMNQLRLAISWSLLEPTRGQLDHSYVDHVLAIAAACNRHGVYSIVDLHQDVWSKYVGEDGAPFRVTLHRAGTSRELSGKENIALAVGDRVVMETSGGGGYGKA